MPRSAAMQILLFLRRPLAWRTDTAVAQVTIAAFTAARRRRVCDNHCHGLFVSNDRVVDELSYVEHRRQKAPCCYAVIVVVWYLLCCFQLGGYILARKEA